MGFKELVIHSGAVHNTIGPALRRGVKKYVINFAYLIQEPKIPPPQKKRNLNIPPLHENGSDQVPSNREFKSPLPHNENNEKRQI